MPRQLLEKRRALVILGWTASLCTLQTRILCKRICSHVLTLWACIIMSTCKWQECFYHEEGIGMVKIHLCTLGYKGDVGYKIVLKRNKLRGVIIVLAREILSNIITFTTCTSSLIRWTWLSHRLCLPLSVGRCTPASSRRQTGPGSSPPVQQLKTTCCTRVTWTEQFLHLRVPVLVSPCFFRCDWLLHIRTVEAL